MDIALDKLNYLTLHVGLARHNGDWNWQNVRSPFTRIFLVTEGQANVHMNGKAYQLTPGHLYMIPSNTTHNCHCDGIFTHYYLHVYEEREYETSIFEKYDFPVEVPSVDTDLRLMNRLLELNPDMALPGSDPQLYDNQPSILENMWKLKQHDLANRIESRGINLIFFSRFFRQAIERKCLEDPRMVEIVEFIHKNLSSDISICHLAEIACLSRGHFVNLFTQNLGLPPLHYINKLKIGKAQLMLITTNRQVKDIAFALGYTDPSYFIRFFRSHTGFTPQEYRTKNMV